MKNDYQSDAFKKLLDKLQQESWQLELIISGFAIYGLILGYEPLQVEQLKAVKTAELVGSNLIGALLTSMSVLILLLLTHVVIRGIWIGAIGLRYVSGDIDYDSLNYSEKFTSFLKNKVGSFDHYISRLENICSTLFALAFLMIFFIISFFMVFGFFAIIVENMEWLESLSELAHKITIGIFALLYFLSVLLVIIDFLSAGLLKKYKWTSKIYFPIYRIFGFITLAFLYRPLVYNFLDQKRARWLAIFIVPIYLLFSFFMTGFGKQGSNYLLFDQETSSIYTNRENYEDQLVDETDMMRFVSIPSKVIEKPYLPVFIGFNPWMEDAVFKKDSTLVPEEDERGYGFNFDRLSSASGAVSISISAESEAHQKRYLNILNSIFELHIDSTVQKSDYGMTTNKDDRFGFETYLDIDNLSRGKHLLRLIQLRVNSEKETKKDTMITIPFWYYPENVQKVPEPKEVQLENHQ